MIVLRIFSALAFALATLASAASGAQETDASEPQPIIEAAPHESSDTEIAARIDEIFTEIGSLNDVSATVSAGVVTLSGRTATAEAAARAERLASRVSGVVTVENLIERDVSVETRLSPAVGQLQGFLYDSKEALPLVALAIFVFAAITIAGWVISGFGGLWRRITPNLFIAELVKTTFRALTVLLASVAALSLLDATAILSAFLGAAGVIGLAVGFAVRDTIENYIASIMLSLRQPFRPNDHVVIDGQTGHVIRLTSRATILMTPEGNHLRIPNASVFKAVIENYTRNPERRFDFELGVDADDDPLAALKTGLDAIKALDFVLEEPAPLGFIRHVGDSNIVIFFAAWIDQRRADFQKSRSVALAAAKNALEQAGFALPEPIYRLRFDAGAAAVLNQSNATVAEVAIQKPEKKHADSKSRLTVDIEPDTHISEKIEEERREGSDEDLLNEAAPVE